AVAGLHVGPPVLAVEALLAGALRVAGEQIPAEAVRVPLERAGADLREVIVEKRDRVAADGLVRLRTCGPRHTGGRQALGRIDVAEGQDRGEGVGPVYLDEVPHVGDRVEGLDVSADHRAGNGPPQIVDRFGQPELEGLRGYRLQPVHHAVPRRLRGHQFAADA